jgi:hypothetical protein
MMFDDLDRSWMVTFDRLLVRAGLIEILELCGIEFINPPLRTRTGEYVGED